MAGKILMFLAITALILPGFKADEENFAVELTIDNFDEAIAKNNHFVKFFAPWDGYVRFLTPMWEELAKMMKNKRKSRVIIAKVDCTKQEMLCSKCHIGSYPSLVFFKLNEKEPVNFDQNFAIPDFEEFIEEILEDHNRYYNPVIIKGEPVELDKPKFAKYVASGKHFIYIYRPWIQETQEFDPIWDQLAKTLENVTAISIDKIRIDHVDFDVRNYLEFYWFEYGEKIEKYSGPLTHDALHDYVIRMLKDLENHKRLLVKQLTSENFDQTIANDVTFVNFFAAACRKCEKLSPIWDQLAKKIHGAYRTIKIAKVDCTYDINKKLCAEQQIEDYPSLIAYKNGKRQVEYGLHLPDLVRYIRKFAGHEEL